MNKELLQQCVVSGQVSTKQVEAHRQAGELPITFVCPEPDRFDHVTRRVLDGLIGIGLMAVMIATWYFA